jgi:anti-sigma B factor antagonist
MELDQSEPRLAIEQTADEDGSPVIVLRGELDISSADTVREALTGVLDSRPERLVFELGELVFIDSSGIAVLVLAANHVDTVELHNTQPIVSRIVELTGLSDTLRIVPS